ncbi:MAG: DUF808 family protein, partial [Pseudomonadota bacterium]|nr:DUF808 family protein [Pseudomonadota bacterium]
DTDMKALEQEKIKGAIRTDFILSAEIIAITLGTITGQSIGMQFLVLSVVAVMITVGVYGLVAGIVKLDDGGLYLSQKDSVLAQKVGRGVLWLAPYLMKTLSILGTLAMFLVGGGILTHGVPPLYEAIAHLAEGMGGVSAAVLPTLADGLIGVLAGAVLVAVITPLQKLWAARAA